MQAFDPNEQMMLRIYTAYQEACGPCRFSGFCRNFTALFRIINADQPTLLRHYQQRFPHMLVDEFQDTNTIQYQWLKLIAGKSNKIMIVGDDDQSIYGWRGARIENIKQFISDFDATNYSLRTKLSAQQVIF
nr:UvrD-helicase domain-containing protein [Pseudoalteromonas spongiae]